GTAGRDEVGGDEEDASIIGQIRVIRREGAALVEDELDPVRAIGSGREVGRANGWRAHEVGKTVRGVRDVTAGDLQVRPRCQVIEAVEKHVDAVIAVIPGGRDDDRRCVFARGEYVNPLRAARV